MTNFTMKQPLVIDLLCVSGVPNAIHELPPICVLKKTVLKKNTVKDWQIYGIGGAIKMANEKLLSKISTIERMLGKIEGIAFVLEDRYSMPILDALEVLDSVVEEIKDGK